MLEYPFGNLQKLNLDWLLSEWRTYQAQIEAAIAPQWDKTATYTRGDVVFFNHTLYACIATEATLRTFKPSEWEITSVIEIINAG